MNIDELSDLVRLHGKAIYGFCHRLTGNKTDTDDLYQDTFLKAMEVHHRMNETYNPKGFLISIAVGLHKNKRRKFAWRQRIAPSSELSEFVEGTYSQEGASPEDFVLSEELRGMILAAASELDDKLKIPLYMYYTAEMSVDDIARELSIPSGTVKSRLYHARKAMKQLLEVDFP